MEGKSGFDVAAYLREYCQMPFMFLSAFSDEATVAQVKALGAVAYLVKPLDIRQIVPAVEAAFAHIGHRSVPAAAAPVQAAADAPLAAPVAMAVGVLMHRYSLARGPALERLQRLARTEQRPLAEQAERLLQAVELLANPGE
jgi:AmiR/NasT family two-component response regulator